MIVVIITYIVGVIIVYFYFPYNHPSLDDKKRSWRLEEVNLRDDAYFYCCEQQQHRCPEIQVLISNKRNKWMPPLMIYSDTTGILLVSSQLLLN